MKGMAAFIYVCAAVFCLSLVMGVMDPAASWWIKGFCIVLGLFMVPRLIYLGREYAKAKPRPVATPLSPQQVMRNTRAELPTEYREWFDWTADIAGFDLSRPWIVGDSPAADEAYHEWIKRQANRGIEIGREGRANREYHWDRHPATPEPKLPTVYRTCPDRTCNISYGPGAGWTHTDQHTWVEMQT